MERLTVGELTISCRHHGALYALPGFSPGDELHGSLLDAHVLREGLLRPTQLVRCPLCGRDLLYRLSANDLARQDVRTSVVQ